MTHRAKKLTWIITPLQSRFIIRMIIRTLNRFCSSNLLKKWMKNGWMIRNSEEESLQRTYAKTLRKLWFGKHQTIMKSARPKRRLLIKWLPFRWREVQPSGRLCIEISSGSSQSLLTEMLKRLRLKSNQRLWWITLFKMDSKTLNKQDRYNFMSMDENKSHPWIMLIFKIPFKHLMQELEVDQISVKKVRRFLTKSSKREGESRFTTRMSTRSPRRRRKDLWLPKKKPLK